MARTPKAPVRSVPEIQADIAAARARISANVGLLRDLRPTFGDAALAKGVRVVRGALRWFRRRK